ncbi:TPA: accessory Sec system protein Asp2 [Streptococcus pneumoniae]|uniref:accessory Sec system protein Asp2 n=1 Tax=Streptococcus pneumoniae TaxID=1313 RepID=UPI00027335C7|nr:accessory Sec system protein Asp2 [Streptococcus pneumoniae]EJG73714.1 accessory secretory protein Asp2 [Streptococcus pneumoniae 2082239]CVY16994.1 accessory secretory protein Asp2 [Streptococcus pneumoniae]CWF36347.1 accessory secretory protein Asp2 [Streptococcus pneumoniae]
MSKELNILQIGLANWENHYDIPENMNWYHFYPNSSEALREIIEKEDINRFHAVLIEDGQYAKDLFSYVKYFEPYTLFYNQNLQINDREVVDFLKKRCAQAIDFLSPQQLINDLSKSLFGGGYGDKLFPPTIQVNPNFTGAISYQGLDYVSLEGEFGQDFAQLAYWAYNIMVQKTLPIELWLEYEKEGNCDFRLVIRLGNLHQRWSRKQFGKFVLGGNILHDSKRDEINYFFHPGDFKPPLTVYFAGYRPAEGFEGYFMMKTLGCPFILFSDPRLEGGAFYLGTDELEGKVKDTITHYLDYLGFDHKDLILSGLSMGTFPALYYGASFEPHAIIVGKPLANLGTIASRGRLDAPGVSNLAFDCLIHHTGGTSSQDMTELDQRFWKIFKQANFSKTTFGLSYMKDEEMDPQAYEQLVSYLCNTGAKILSKGTAGRHNDDTDTNISWFLHFYRMVLETGFGREKR